MNTFINNQGLELTAVQVKGKTYAVTFSASGSSRLANLDNIRAGKVKDLYHPSRYGVGYDGDADKTTPYYSRAKDLWSNMLRRCYTSYARCYNGRVIVSPRWHCFANFLYDLPGLQGFQGWLSGSGFELDKDLLIEGNSVYCREHCQFVPTAVNRAAGKGGKKLVNGVWVRPHVNN